MSNQHAPEARLLSNVELLSLAVDTTGFASIRIRDRDSGDVYTVPGGYVPLVEKATEAQEAVQRSALVAEIAREVGRE